MGVIMGSVESLWMDIATNLQQPSEVQRFVERLIEALGLDRVVLYLMIEERYYAMYDTVPVQSMIFYEILQALGEKPFSKGRRRTVLREAQRRKEMALKMKRQDQVIARLELEVGRERANT